jgi:hypothetical protein
MNRLNLGARTFVLALLLLAALVASSCESGGGMGVGGVGYPARWGGGTSGPPVFAGGPSF